MVATGRQNVFLEKGSATARLFDEASHRIPGGTSRLHYYHAPYPIYGKSAEGCRLTDVDGVERLDFLNCMTALIPGHGHPAIKAALHEQIELGTAWSEPAGDELDLARLVADRVETIEKIRFTNSGTEAVMYAIKLARAYSGRDRIAKFEGFYHGYYDHMQVSAGPAAADPGPDRAPVAVANSGGLAASVLDEVVVIPYNDPDALERILAEHAGTIGAFITDPLSNRAGFPRPRPGFLEFLREITRRYYIPLIYDEIISFRVGYGGAQGEYGGDPDLTTLGKVIGGGLPGGAVGGRGEIMDLLDPTRGAATVISGGTFSANPMTMVAGKAALEQLTPAEVDRLNHLGARLRDGANAVFADAGENAQISGDGSVFRVVMNARPIVDYRDTLRGAAPKARMSQLHLNLLDEGIIVSRDGLGGLSTPMGEPEIDDFIAALDRAVAALPAGD